VADGAKLYPAILGTSTMIVSNISERFDRETAHLPMAFAEPHWYVAYTCANHEKRVTQQLLERSVEHFLPLHDSVRRWNDRRVQLQLPLFPGYVFVYMALRDRLKILQVPGVARLVGFGAQPCALPEAEIEAMRRCLRGKVRLEPHPFVQVGQRVRVKSGTLKGLQGLVIRKKNGLRFVISLELIQRSAAVEVESIDLEGI